MKVSVILPARNEELLIKKAVTDIYKYLKKKDYSFEILVVVNGSVDNTDKITKSLAQKLPQVKALKSRAGYGHALREGMKMAKGDYVIVYNVDFYDFKLIDKIDSDMGGKDIIIGSKLARGSEDRRSFSRHLISLLFNWYLKLLYGFKGTDTHGIKLIRKTVITSTLPLCKTSTGIFDTEFILRAQRKGYRIADFPVRVGEKRPTRFSGRLLETPIDLLRLNKALWIWKAEYLFPAVLILLSTVLAVNVLKVDFAWTDDTEDMMFSQNFFQNISALKLGDAFGSLVEVQVGRLRPVYRLWRVVVYFLADGKSAIHFLFLSMIIFATVFLIYKTVFHFTKSHVGGFVAGSLFLFIPVNIENWTRLSPAEPLSGFLVLLSVYLFMVSKKYLWASIVFFLAIFSKETSIALVPAIGTYYISLLRRDRSQKLLNYLLFTILSALFLIALALVFRTGYGLNYHFNFTESLYRFQAYLFASHRVFPIGIFFLGTYFLRMFYSSPNTKKIKILKVDFVELLFLSFFFFFLIFQSPWRWVLGRYMLPAVIGAAIFVGIEFTRILEDVRKKARWLSVAILTFSLAIYSIYLIYSLVGAIAVITRTKQINQSAQSMLKFLAKDVPRDGLVLFNIKDENKRRARLLEKSLPLKLYYHRADIRAEYLEYRKESDTASYIVSGPGFGEFPYLREEDLVKNKKLVFLYRIEFSNRYVVLTNPVAFFKLSIRKLAEYLFKGYKLNSEGLWAYYGLYDWWNIYYIP